MIHNLLIIAVTVYISSLQLLFKLNSKMFCVKYYKGETSRVLLPYLQFKFSIYMKQVGSGSVPITNILRNKW